MATATLGNVLLGAGTAAGGNRPPRGGARRGPRRLPPSTRAGTRSAGASPRPISAPASNDIATESGARAGAQGEGGPAARRDPEHRADARVCAPSRASRRSSIRFGITTCACGIPKPSWTVSRQRKVRSTCSAAQRPSRKQNRLCDRMGVSAEVTGLVRDDYLQLRVWGGGVSRAVAGRQRPDPEGSLRAAPLTAARDAPLSTSCSSRTGRAAPSRRSMRCIPIPRRAGAARGTSLSSVFYSTASAEP